MSLADRNYHRHQHQGGGFMSQLTPVVKWLLIANVAIFILDYLILPSVLRVRVDRFHPPPLVMWGAFSVQSALVELHLWQFVTFQFLHGSLGHVMFNCIGIYFFGPWMEHWWGSRKFLIFYLLCGCAGAAFFTLLLFMGLLPDGMDTPLVGASAGLYGIFIGVAVIAPDLRVALLFPPIELSMRQLAIALMGIAAGAVLFKLGGNEGGQAGHLGGAILGYVLMRYPRLLGTGPRVEILQPKAFTNRYEAKIRPHTDLRLDEDTAVDLILDKVSREGFQSLSQAERDILRKAAERQSSDP